MMKIIFWKIENRIFKISQIRKIFGIPTFIFQKKIDTKMKNFNRFFISSNYMPRTCITPNMSSQLQVFMELHQFNDFQPKGSFFGQKNPNCKGLHRPL